MSPSQLNVLIQQLKETDPAINAAWMVVDDSQLTKNLAERGAYENMFLVAVLPNYGTTGTNADNYRTTTQGMLMILEKTDYSELSQEELIAVFERTFVVAERLRNSLLEQATTGCAHFLRNMFVDSLQLEPLWKKADCNGWSLTFDIE